MHPKTTAEQDFGKHVTFTTGITFHDLKFNNATPGRDSSIRSPVIGYM